MAPPSREDSTSCQKSSPIGSGAGSSLNRRPRPVRHDFVEVKLLGKGSVGTVTKVMSKKTGNVYALKAINKQRILQNCLKEQLLAEIRTQMTVQHDNLLRCFDYFEDGECVYLVLELAVCGDLYGHLVRGALSEHDAAHVFSQVAEGLRHLHALNIAHRDLKPENIMLKHDFEVKIADFGCVSQKNTRSTFCGTACMLAPEMISGTNYDHRVDVWALGLLLFEMLTGSSLFDSDKNIMTTFERIMKQDISASLENRVPLASRSLIEGLLQRNPDKRMDLKTALAHPWVVSCREARVRAEPPQLADSISSSVAKNYLLDLKGQGLDPLNTTSTSTSSGKSPNSTHRDVSFNWERSSTNRLDTSTSSVGSRGDVYRFLREATGSATIPMKAVPEPKDELPCATCSVCGQKMPLDVASIEQHDLMCRPRGGLPPSTPPATSRLSPSMLSPSMGSKELYAREPRGQC